ncbi:MAG: amidase [Leucobacter sp.]
MSALPDTAVELRDALRAGEVTAREATEHYLARIASRSDLGAFVSVTTENAIEEADKADAKREAIRRRDRLDSHALPPLHGLPTAHKDLSNVAGAITTHGSAAVPHLVARRDYPGVAVLRKAGTISLGKTQVPEFGLNAYSENLIAPPARNPLDPALTPGGSSGGSAAAVAAGLLPVAPGSDAGGSIRIPSLACGLVGLKAGLGTIITDLAQGDHDEFGAQRLAVTGPIARTAEDAAMLFDAMQGAQGDEDDSALRAVREADALSGLRIGMSTASPFDAVYPTSLSPEAAQAYDIAAARLANRNHLIEQAKLRYDPRYTEVFTSCWMASLSLLKLSTEAERLLTPFTRLYRERALSKSQRQHFASARELQRIGTGLRQAWSRYDVMLTPGLTTTPPRIGAFTSLSPDDDYKLQCEWTPYTSMVNVSGLPAIAVPILTLPSGLSMGVHLIGGEGSEPQLLQLAQQLTQP